MPAARVESSDDTRRELAELASGLLEHATTVRREYEELARLIADANGGDEAPIRYVAAAMALAGWTREEADAHIRAEYGVIPEPELLDLAFERGEE